MDLLRVIEELKRERDDIAEAILALERLASVTAPKKRGRPPKKNKALPVPKRISSGVSTKGFRHHRSYAHGGL